MLGEEAVVLYLFRTLVLTSLVNLKKHSLNTRKRSFSSGQIELQINTHLRFLTPWMWIRVETLQGKCSFKRVAQRSNRDQWDQWNYYKATKIQRPATFVL